MPQWDLSTEWPVNLLIWPVLGTKILKKSTTCRKFNPDDITCKISPGGQQGACLRTGQQQADPETGWVTLIMRGALWSS